VSGGLTPRPSRDFAPAGDLLFAPPKSRQKALPCKTGPAGSPAMLEAQGRAELTSLRSVQTSVASQILKRAARAPWASALLGGLEGEAPEQPQQPTAKPEGRSRRGIPLPPSEPAEERKALRPRAQHASSTDFAQLSERSVAKRVLCEASRPEYRRGPEAKRRAGGSGAVSLVTFLGAQESDSPAGAKSPLGLGVNPMLTEASPCL
jgi:hypothetical protein